MLIQIKAVLSIIITLLFAQASFGQDISGKIIRSKGSSVKYNFNSVRRIQEGMTYTDHIELTIIFCDSAYISAGWELIVRATEPEFFAAMNSIPTIPLDVITISSRMEDGTSIAVDEVLDQTDILVGEGIPPTTPEKCIQDKVILSFTCNSLMGYSFDFYDLNLDFELKSK